MSCFTRTAGWVLTVLCEITGSRVSEGENLCKGSPERDRRDGTVLELMHVRCARQVTERMQGRIQQWPQYILQEGQSAWHEQSPQSTQATPDQGAKGRQPYGYVEGEEDEDDDDMFGGPKF